MEWNGPTTTTLPSTNTHHNPRLPRNTMPPTPPIQSNPTQRSHHTHLTTPPFPFRSLMPLLTYLASQPMELWSGKGSVHTHQYHTKPHPIPTYLSLTVLGSGNLSTPANPRRLVIRQGHNTTTSWSQGYLTSIQDCLMVWLWLWPQGFSPRDRHTHSTVQDRAHMPPTYSDRESVLHKAASRSSTPKRPGTRKSLSHFRRG